MPVAVTAADSFDQQEHSEIILKIPHIWETLNLLTDATLRII